MTAGEIPDRPLPDELPVLPLRNSVFFPGGIIPIGVGRPKTLALLRSLQGTDSLFGIVPQRKPDIDDPTPDDLYPVGTSAHLLKMIKIGEDNFHIVVQGVHRFRIREFTQEEPYFTAKVDKVEDRNKDDVEVEALTINLKKVAQDVIKLMPEVPSGAAELVENITDPVHLADIITSNIDASIAEKVVILDTSDLRERLAKVLELVHRKLEVLRISNKIDSQVKGKMTKTQREYYLRQQLEAIKEELGELESEESDIEELKKRLLAAELPAEAEKAAQKELGRLKNMQPSSPEYTVSRTYLEWFADLPWEYSTEDNLDIKMVREDLDRKHYDLEKVKKRIVEHLAVRKLKSDMKGPIFCLVGPPGVGKTSLGQCIADAMGRKFVRVSLGGVRDEAEIRGHRRTYVGALPGRIIQGMKKAGSNNPIFMLDEIDKLSHDFRGDPASALLEVLDPEQNHSFSDHYLDVSFDLSKVLFIATANLLDPIPPALKDRMEVLELPGYTLEEKLKITTKHILPKQIEEHGLSDDNIEIPEEVLEKIVGSYTREAGVRNLERTVASVCRAVAVDVAEGNAEFRKVEVDDLSEILGPEKYQNEVAERTGVPGVATGLAWTQVGGDILFIEATRMPGKGALTLTGQLGDVMQESARAALSFVRTNARMVDMPEENFLEKHDIHIHIPTGGVPKDGPSAGITMLSALVSLLTGVCVRHDVAMTGEVTLRGAVLPVGGIKEKILAAHRAGIRRVVLPERNRKDLVEIPQNTQDEMEFVFVSRMEEALRQTLERSPFLSDSPSATAEVPHASA